MRKIVMEGSVSLPGKGISSFAARCMQSWRICLSTAVIPSLDLLGSLRREMGWDETTTGGAGGAGFDHFGGKRVEGGGGTKVKWINLLNYIISQPI